MDNKNMLVANYLLLLMLSNTVFMQVGAHPEKKPETPPVGAPMYSRLHKAKYEYKQVLLYNPGAINMA